MSPGSRRKERMEMGASSQIHPLLKYAMRRKPPTDGARQRASGCRPDGVVGHDNYDDLDDI